VPGRITVAARIAAQQMSELEEEIQRRQALGLPDDVDDIASAIESDELEEFDDWDGDGEEGR